MKFIRQLDGLRFVAIFMVLVAHWIGHSFENPILKNIPFGTGVTLFFVISGFLITRILMDFKIANEVNQRSNWYSVRSFYVRRTLRIFPIYYLLIFFLLAINFQNTSELFPWLVSYTLNIKVALTNDFPGSFTHFWSLAVEEQFYIFWAFLIVFLPKKYLKGVIITSIVLSIVLKFYLVYFTPYWAAANGLVFTNMHSLGLGALLAHETVFGDGYQKQVKKFRIALVVLIVAYFVVFVIPYHSVFFEKLRHFSDPFLALIYFVMVVIAVNGAFTKCMKCFLENKIVLYLGKISYGLYVFHLFIGPLYFNFLNRYIIGIHPQKDWEFFIVFFFINVALASISWFSIEKPIIGLKKYFRY
jgi:peptidoglycan/LPS O-acetylase OafA/YrhL